MRCFAFLTLVTVSVLLSSCDNIKDGLQDDFDHSFSMAFRASFMKHCVGSTDTESQHQVCTCIVQNLLSTYTVEQLKDTAMIQTYIDTEALPACQLIEV